MRAALDPCLGARESQHAATLSRVLRRADSFLSFEILFWVPEAPTRFPSGRRSTALCKAQSPNTRPIRAGTKTATHARAPPASARAVRDFDLDTAHACCHERSRAFSAGSARPARAAHLAPPSLQAQRWRGCRASHSNEMGAAMHVFLCPPFGAFCAHAGEQYSAFLQREHQLPRARSPQWWHGRLSVPGAFYAIRLSP